MGDGTGRHRFEEHPVGSALMNDSVRCKFMKSLLGRCSSLL